MFKEKLALEGKTALVIGAGGGGIGTATSLALAEAGADIVAVDIVPDRVKDTEQRVAAMGGRCLGITADIVHKSEVDRVIRRALKEFGAIHCLANIAGGMQQGQWHSILDYPEDVFDQVVGLNLRYSFLTCQAVGRAMVDRGIAGSMVNVASVSGINSAPSHGPYGAAKSGLTALTRTMAIEWCRYGIRVNAVAPGTIKTPRNQATWRASHDVERQKALPLGRQGEPGEIACGILFLLSDMASYITGHTLVMDGGATSKFMLSGEVATGLEAAGKRRRRR